ncbi:DUF5677 domain-containing protein, partial [Yoonia sp.]|nr:DUF5677 domain-containing protein [Yoonia sp.]
KAPFRALTLRETAYWRFTDLVDQSHCLAERGHFLGARILLRSAYETFFMMTYLNNMIDDVCANKFNFNDFSDKTTRLILGSKDGSTKHIAINILTILKHCERVYPGIQRNYDLLSETAHPNADGMQLGYTKIDFDKSVIKFNSQWRSIYSGRHGDALIECIRIFVHEYDERFSTLFPALEDWIIQNDTML